MCAKEEYRGRRVGRTPPVQQHVFTSTAACGRQHSTQLSSALPLLPPAAAPCRRSTCATSSTGSLNCWLQCGHRSNAPPLAGPAAAAACCMPTAPLLHPPACAVSACSISCCTLAKRAPHCGHSSAPDAGRAATGLVRSITSLLGAAGAVEPPLPPGGAPARCRCRYCCSWLETLSLVRTAAAVARATAPVRPLPLLPADAGRCAAPPPPLPESMRRRLCDRLSRPLAAAAAAAAAAARPGHAWSAGRRCLRHTVMPQSRHVYVLVEVSFSLHVPAGCAAAERWKAWWERAQGSNKHARQCRQQNVSPCGLPAAHLS